MASLDWRAALSYSTTGVAINALQHLALSLHRGCDADKVADWHCCDKFCSFLLALTREVAPRKKGVASEARPAKELSKELVDCAKSYRPSDSGLATGAEDVAVSLVWPPWFTMATLHGSAGLGWPQEGCEDHENGVTYLELMANFVATTGVCVPAVHKLAYTRTPCRRKGF